MAFLHGLDGFQKTGEAEAVRQAITSRVEGGLEFIAANKPVARAPVVSAPSTP